MGLLSGGFKKVGTVNTFALNYKWLIDNDEYEDLPLCYSWDWKNTIVRWRDVYIDEKPLLTKREDDFQVICYDSGPIPCLSLSWIDIVGDDYHEFVQTGEDHIIDCGSISRTYNSIGHIHNHSDEYVLTEKKTELNIPIEEWENLSQNERNELEMANKIAEEMYEQKVQDRKTFNKSCVYVIKSSNPSTYKIGRSVDPRRRLGELQTGNENTLTLIHEQEVSHVNQVEAFCHYVFDKHSLGGEWFLVDDEIMDNFIAKVLPTIVEFVEFTSRDVLSWFPKSKILKEIQNFSKVV